jgi:hypothetical protein
MARQARSSSSSTGKPSIGQNNCLFLFSDMFPAQKNCMSFPGLGRRAK